MLDVRLIAVSVNVILSAPGAGVNKVIVVGFPTGRICNNAIGGF